MTDGCGGRGTDRREPEENFWRTDPCGTAADTYIEWRFEQLCRQSESGMHILDEWHTRKGEYVARIATTVYDFQHFSRHDASHSVSILESIEMLLGRDRVEMLSRGDLWLLLESAYFHDIGMSMTHEEIVKLWENDDEFHKYVRERLTGDDVDEKYAANLYYQMDNLIHSKKQMEELQEGEEIDFEGTKAWMVQVQNALLLLTTSYKRRRHAQDAVRHFNSTRESYVPTRLYKVVADVSRMHGANSYESIMQELKYCTKGVDSMVLHPQFAAAMLRIGDLLDMDNNRFDPYTMEHFGDFPKLSMLHYKKHHALTHLAIRPEKIEAEAISDDYDVCRVTNDWFRMLKSEVDHLICYWNVMAPEKLKGCLLEPGSYEVFYKDRKTLFSEHPELDFNVNKGQFIKLVVGSNIYDGNFEFYREYLQNALDASKMKLWLDLKRGRYTPQVNREVRAVRDLTPLDIDRAVYEQYEIEVAVDLDMASQLVMLSINDQGIGMDKECVEAIASIGSGWKKRKKYAAELTAMPDWLRPTGGFGIGIQSAFMITREVQIITRSGDETMGRKLTIRNGGANERSIVEEACMVPQSGSVISMKIPLAQFQNWNDRRNESGKSHTVYSPLPYTDPRRKQPPQDFFDKDENLNYVIRFFEMLTSHLLVDSPIPVRIVNAARKDVVCCEPYLPYTPYWEKGRYYKGDIVEYCSSVQEYGGKQYQCIYTNPDKDGRIYIWQKDRSILASLALSDKKSVPMRIRQAFKNVVVKNAVEQRELPAPFEYLEGCLDFLGGKAENVVRLNRNDFADEFEHQQVFADLLHVFIRALRDRYRTYSGMMRNSLDLENNYIYTLIGELLAETPGWTGEISGEMMAARGAYVEANDRPKLNEQKYAVKGSDVLANIRAACAGEEPVTLYAIVPDVYKHLEETFPIDSFMPKSNQAKKLLCEFNSAEFIITDNRISEILAASGKFDRKGIRIVNREDLLVKFSKVEEKPEAVIDAEQFYKQIYTDANNKERVTRESPGIHEKLLVDQLPYATRENGGHQKRWLISPISNNSRETLERLVHNGTKISWEKFRDTVTAGDDYKALLKWTMERQVNQPMLDDSEMHREYEMLLKKIYQYNFPPL
ncbi:MAG: ATP-binding protein [Clostridiales bacterium]|nr:ATP-binding protein [Clostridiales bacterium]